MKLRPDDYIQKALISTTSRFVGEYESDALLLAHAWPDFYSRSVSARLNEGPTSRSAFIFAFETAPFEKKKIGAQLPDYSHMGNLICSYLSVLYGKRFDSHGLLEGSGFFHVPELSQFNHLCNHMLPQNSHAPRVDFNIPLNLVEFSRIESLLLSNAFDAHFKRTFQGACKFYIQALQNAETEPEVAYLHLITAGEILSNFHNYDKDSLLDDQTREILALIQANIPNGLRISNFIANRLLQVKKRFVKTITNLIDDGFFTRSEAKEPFGRFKADSFKNSIGAAYDLRSRYVHTGVPFGNWISLSLGGINSEVPFGKPVVEDDEFEKILAIAPTYVGLERVIRYCLLTFAKQNGAYVDGNSEKAK